MLSRAWGLWWMMGLMTACTQRPYIITQPTAIAVDTSGASRPAHAVTPPTPPRTYDTYWSAIGDLDFPAARHLAKSTAQSRFAELLHDAQVGRNERAEQTSLDLLHSSDSLIRVAARVAYTALLSTQARWRELAHFVAQSPDSTLAVRDDAGVEMWAPAFQTLEERTTFIDSVVVIPFTRTPTGTPVITVRINGTETHLWIDTGSSISIVSTPIAGVCGITPLIADTLELVTAIGRIRARPAAIRTLEVGGLRAEDVPAMIVDPAELTLRAGTWTTSTRPVAIEGIIGLDIIRHLDLTIDDRHGTVTIRQPTPRPNVSRNVFWFGVPIVTLTSERGVPIYLSLDTGSEETYATLGLQRKTGSRAVLAERRHLHGFGGSREERGALLPRVRLHLGNARLTLERVFLYTATYPTIFELDGTLGADISRGSVIRIDMSNGRLDVW